MQTTSLKGNLLKSPIKKNFDLMENDEESQKSNNNLKSFDNINDEILIPSLLLNSNVTLQKKINKLNMYIPFNFKQQDTFSYQPFFSFHSTYNYQREQSNNSNEDFIIGQNEQIRECKSAQIETQQTHKQNLEFLKIKINSTFDLEIPEETPIDLHEKLQVQPKKFLSHSKEWKRDVTKTKKLQLFKKPTVLSIESEVVLQKIDEIPTTIINHPYSHLIFSQSISQKKFLKHLVLTYKGLIYATKYLKSPSEQFIKRKKINIDIPKKYQNKKIILFDLDETLIYTSIKVQPDVILIQQTEKGEILNIPLKVRPNARELLNNLKDKFNLGIFTASKRIYAKAILNYLDPKGEIFTELISRESCLETKNGFFIKDLRILGNINLKDIVIIDNLSHSFGFQIENGIPIIEWCGDQNDQELKYIENYLVNLLNCDDVRTINTQYFKLRELASLPSDNLQI